VVSLFLSSPFNNNSMMITSSNFGCTIKGNWRITGTDRFLPGFPGLEREFMVVGFLFFFQRGCRVACKLSSLEVVNIGGSPSGQGVTGVVYPFGCRAIFTTSSYNTHFDKHINLAFRTFFAIADGTFTPSRNVLSLGFPSSSW
jgi:hypothetical protein